MKTLGVSCALALALSITAFAKPGWTDDYDKALEKAKAEKKHVLLDFTGSDWCGWCIKLDKEIFSKSDFKSFAKENLILVELDYPRGKRLPKKTLEQNAKLKDQYQIRGYPTVIILDPEGKKVGNLGYMEGGPEPFIAKIKELQGSKGE